MPTPKPSLREWTEREVAEALRVLDRLGRQLTHLVYRQVNEWHVLSFRALWGEPLNGRLLVTRSYARYEKVFAALYQARNPKKKPAARAHANQTRRVGRVDRERMG